MIGKRCMKVLTLAILGVCASVVTATAQITTGTVNGTVKDAQGGVIPGATVVLISETKGTKTAPAVTSGAGDYVFPNVTPDTYTVEVSMEGFKTLSRKGIKVSGADRVSVPNLTLDVGGAAETVNVIAESPLVQASSGERSFAVATEQIENLPINHGNFTSLTSLTPGVVQNGASAGGTRLGGAGQNNIMMDGISAMDTGNNGQMLSMNIESIAEVKVLTQGYQAEYGRSSGLQITAVTKSGTNRLRGSAYDIMTDSKWNENSWVNAKNGDPKARSKTKTYGYSVGGPVGKPGGSNKLFFFYSHEYRPVTAAINGGNPIRLRVPTAAERAGDFSQTLDNNGALFNFIHDPLSTAACSATSTAGCFQDGGVIGKIPASRLYQVGINVLNRYPLPNLTQAVNTNYNFQIGGPGFPALPTTDNLTQQPAIRVDYQLSSKLRVNAKYSGQRQRRLVTPGNIPGFNDVLNPYPFITNYGVTVNYTWTPTTFVEGTYGFIRNQLAGGGSGGILVNDSSNRLTALPGFPILYPDAGLVDQRYYAYKTMLDLKPVWWDGTRINLPPVFGWGGRIGAAPPNQQFPGFLNINRTQDVAISLTKVAGRHTMKTGFYNNHSNKEQNQNSGATFGALNFSNDTSNPIDAQFGFANAILGVFSSYNQLSRYIEGAYLYNNTEGYIQDNWKITPRLTVDYGVRLVHQQPQYDSLGQASNFLPEKWSLNQAPVLYAAGCVNGVNPCSGTNRQARNPLTDQLLGIGSAAAIGTIVPGTGDPLNGLFLSGHGITKTTYTYPSLGVGPRFGFAYDLSSEQRLVLRGGGGLFYDRPNGNDIYAQVTNPPAVQNVTVRYAQLQSLSSGLSTVGAPALNVYQYDAGLPSSWQWNTGVQMVLPWSTSLDVAYTGQRSWNTPQAVNVNAVDFGTAFLTQYQDPTLPASTTPGATAVVTDLMRAYKGYGSINRRMSALWRTYHGINVSFQRRFRNGVSFGFNDSISVYDHQNSNARLEHRPDGSFSYRDDQKQADALFQSDPVRHTMKGNFIWDLPDLKSSESTLRAIGLVVNDWQLSGIWTATTSAPYQIGFSYQNGGSNVNLTGSPDYGARVRLVGDPGSGCTDDIFRQFNTAAFQGPLVGSVGLESGNNYVKGCFQSVLDLSIARNIRLPRGRNVQLRVDMFNAPNAAIITNRNTTMNLASPSDPVTITNLPFDANGNLVVSRSAPRGAGFGVATGYLAPRSVQGQIRFSF